MDFMDFMDLQNFMELTEEPEHKRPKLFGAIGFGRIFLLIPLQNH